MDINIQTIPHDTQRYQTCGDWWWDEFGNLQVRVSDMGNIIYQWLVAEHEINEALMCQQAGVSEVEVSDFDMKFEALRETLPKLIGDQEPGDMVSAPYYKQHQAATQIEQLSANHHKIDWKKYNKAVEEL